MGREWGTGQDVQFTVAADALVFLSRSDGFTVFVKGHAFEVFGVFGDEVGGEFGDLFGGEALLSAFGEHFHSVEAFGISWGAVVDHGKDRHRVFTVFPVAVIEGAAGEIHAAHGGGEVGAVTRMACGHVGGLSIGNDVWIAGPFF